MVTTRRHQRPGIDHLYLKASLRHTQLHKTLDNTLRHALGRLLALGVNLRSLLLCLILKGRNLCTLTLQSLIAMRYGV